MTAHFERSSLLKHISESVNGFEQLFDLVWNLVSRTAATVGVRFECKVTRIANFFERFDHLLKVYLHRKWNSVGIVNKVVVVNVKCLQMLPEGENHLFGRGFESAHLSVTDVKTRDKIGVVHRFDVCEKIIVMATSRLANRRRTPLYLTNNSGIE